MAPPAARKKLSLAPLIVGAVVVVVLIAALVYLNKPVAKPAEGPATPEAKAYLPNLELSNIDMKAAENLMRQRVVEIQGDIRNKGPHALESVYVYCLFYGVDGREIYRERVPIVPSKGAPLAPGDTRHFRLPFDTVPEAWNQAMPKMVIAQITFAR